MRIQVSENLTEHSVVIKVIGVGGAGGNAINRMAEAGIRDVELIAANSDAQDLRRSLAHVRVQIGESLTRGLGVGGDSTKGRMAMLESEPQIKEILKGADLAFITGGMGGGTGTGGAPIVASWAKEMGILTIGVVTRPFAFEKFSRANIAEEGIQEMRKSVDTLLVIPNQRLLDVIDSETTTESAFRVADDILRKSIQSISDVVTTPGIINMDLSDIRAVMKDAGDALIGMGEAAGPGRASVAAKAAIHSPLLENVVMDGAARLSVNITARSSSLKMSEIEEAMGIIGGAASQDAKIKVGAVYDEMLGDAIRITVIATGFPAKRAHRHLPNSGRSLLTEVFSDHHGNLSARKPVRASPEPALIGRESSSGASIDPLEWIKPAFLRLKVRKIK
ncbi:MAG: cell division protein FtsZ [Elusimicrobiota bacterium]